MRQSCCVLLVLCMVGCGGGGGGSSNTTPTTPTTPTPQVNRSPVIASVTVTPSFGVADLVTFNFAAIASDPDGDSLTYAWNLAGNSRSGANASIIFASPGGNGQGTVTVTDGKGGSANSSVNFVVGSMTGRWVMTTAPAPLPNSSYQLTQGSTGLVTGSFTLPGIGNGNTDPAQPGQINAAGALTMRVKIGAFTDFTINGTMDSTGTRISGSVTGSGFTGQPIVLTKQ
jgi:PKD domain